MSVLLRGGRRDVGAIEAPGALAMAETVGEGVEDDIFEVVTGDKLPSPNLDFCFQWQKTQLSGG